MPASKAKNLSSLFRSAVKSAAATSKPKSSADDASLKFFVSSIDNSSCSTSTSQTTPYKQRPAKSLSKTSVPETFSDLAIESLNIAPLLSPGRQTKYLSKEISSILCGTSTSEEVSSDSIEDNDDEHIESVLGMPWFSSLSHSNISLRRKELSRDRKQKWIFKSTQIHRFDRLVNLCGQKLGTDATIRVFGKLGRETGVKEFNALVALCIEKARETLDEDVWLQEITKAYKLLMLMRERGNSNSLPRVAYYEMLLWIRVNNEVKIKELCDLIVTNDEGDNTNFKEHYLLALFESDRKKELLLLLEIVDITKFSSLDNLTNIFRSLGRLSLESFAEKFIRELKGCDIGAESISNFIYSYATSVPNLAVDDIISKFKHLHVELEVVPSSAAYEKLIGYCCNSLKAHVALDIVDQMFEAGLTVSIETFHSILCACEESCDYNLVHRIYSTICHNNLKPNNETIRAMIALRVKMKDFEGAYRMIKDLDNMKLVPTAGMYNAIMAGYFREKNIHAGLRVLKEMEDATVKPDSQTFTYLIGNCVHEEDIVKYYEEMKRSAVQITKHIFMALINAYAACGQFEKAKQVVLDKGVPVKSLNELKSVLASALASHGRISEALEVSEEIKEAECKLEPRAIICLIGHLQTEGQLSRLLQLLEDLKDSDQWIDGCCRVISYCVQFKHLSSAVDLLKQLVDNFCDDEVATEVIFDEVSVVYFFSNSLVSMATMKQVFSKIAESERADVQFGLKLLQAIKEQLDVSPSRKSLDFLLSACASAKDLQSSLLIWKEYQIAGLPYNVLSYLRMYQALLASGDHTSATKMLNKMPRDDPHVCCVIKACKATYIKPASPTGKKKETYIEPEKKATYIEPASPTGKKKETYIEPASPTGKKKKKKKKKKVKEKEKEEKETAGK
ncbi:hypothetical protein Vadar_027623 [Vaccinium darrowii]|uniref:Uncharacterized protein n=1 Tax=Vaccinium darrowii TaxID=229202 RepID=A0ACB7Z6J0_9ERIC|nr:hypothetical protein Vadar_027623 [Vaccinium darrowii]